MKKITFFFLLISSFIYSQRQTANFSVSPATFEEDEEITITISNVNPSIWGVSDIYLWAWSFDSNDTSQDSPTNGDWNNSNESQKLTDNGDGTFSFTMTPTTFYNRTGLSKIGMLVKAKNGSGDRQSQDQIFEVGKFQLTLNNPTSSTTILNSGSTLNINATSSLAANFTLKRDGNVLDQESNSTNYNFSSVVSSTANYSLEAENSGDVQSVSFTVIVRPNVTTASVPNGMLDGININPNDPTKATLVFYAPNKDFVYVIGDFNDWQIESSYLMRKDNSEDRFWIELKNLDPNRNYTFQYLVDGLIRVADPYSTVILDEYNDQFIDAATYPNLTPYPTGKTNHAVTLLNTGEEEYNWQIENFNKPKKKDLVIYELLIRDFDALHSFNAIKNRLDYLESLGINAIEFMPLNEFDGNLSWGYNPSFHMALDKYYGTRNAFKALVDECHKRGMAVIIDIVFNHGTGQNPYFRLWNTDNGGYNGTATAENPFYNTTPMHPFNVFNDMNHEFEGTQNYVKRITQYWIEEYKVDGFRWDLSKGFTQQQTNDVGAWGQYQQARVDILKKYADFQWEKDPKSFMILEHFAANNEETALINYRLDEGKGMMVWGNHHGNYKEAALGNHSNNSSDFSWISYINRGWSEPQNVSYMVSHDEERLMYENLNFGNFTGSYNTKEMSTALDRMELNGAFYFTVPGPKMIWQFDELGYDISINQNGRTGEKPILWNYYEDSDRRDLYNTWSKLIELKLTYEIFETADFTIDTNNPNGLKKIQLNDTNASDIQHINVIGNFGLTTQNINPLFQETGTWYDLLNDNSEINVTNVNSLISLEPGEFRVYANNSASLSNENFFLEEEFTVFPNPSKEYISVNVFVKELNLYTITGKKVLEYSGAFRENYQFKINKNLNTGIYLLDIKTEKGRGFKKIIIE